MPDIKTRVKICIAQALQLNISPDQIANDQAIFDTMAMPGLTSDSLAALEIVAAISGEFNIIPTEVNAEHFRDINSLSDFISKAIR
jgi:acyl carrier protein